MKLVKFAQFQLMPALLMLTLSACQLTRAPGNTDALQAPAGLSDAKVIDAQSRHERHVEVTISAFVDRMLPDDTVGLPHERFLLHLSNGTTVLVAHDTKMAPRVPLHEGDRVTVHGEYIYNDKGGVIHWTHHSTNLHHEPGWIEFNGRRYQ